MNWYKKVVTNFKVLDIILLKKYTPTLIFIVVVTRATYLTINLIKNFKNARCEYCG